ncbi:MAG: site-2 protease family protein [Treponema sp.]|nr:site-2 protease family protein [Treponema sp.]
MKWLYGILCLFFLILFHEFGHFLAAKLFGVKVESFSIGFGPILLHKTFKGTDYRLSLFPLGGYCGMKGENDFRTAVEEHLPEIKAEKDSLYGVHPIKRAAIGFAGPLFNFIFAIIAYSLINLIGYTYYTYSNKIILADELYAEQFADEPSAAKLGGLQTGDLIIEINGKEITDFSEIIEEISVRPDEDIRVKVDRDGEILLLNVHTQMDKSQGTGKLGVAADTSIKLTKHTPKYNVFTAFGRGFLDTIDSLVLTIKSIGILFKGIDVKNAVSGPARVTEMLGSTVKEGFAASTKIGFISMFNLMAIISISLFFMNLLPVPVLDGGLILIALIETVFRKRLNPRIQYYVQFIGLAFIIFLFIIGTYSDISYFIKQGSMAK